MSSAKSLLDARECGQANPLVQLSHNFSQNNAKIATGVERQIQAVMPSISTGDAMAQEYLGRIARQAPAPVSFNMNSLIRQLPQSSSASNLSQQWGKEFLKTRPKAPHEYFSAQWTQQYILNSQALAAQTPRSSSMMELESAWTSASATQLPGTNSQAQAHPMMWSAEYLDKFDTESQKSHVTGDSWADDYLEQVKHTTQNLTPPHNDLNNLLYDEAWDSIMGEEGRNPEDFLAMPFEHYKFVDNNPFLNEADAAAKGAEMLTNGNIAEAIQYYEAAVIQNPQDAKSWTSLGLCHAENEQDLQAISAFRRALEIDPQSQDALLAISVSFANESMENEALIQLEKWIAVFNKDPGAFQTAGQRPNAFSNYSSLDQNKFRQVENSFLDAARRQGGSVDPDLQNALGVLYNLNRNFERAVDSIKAALGVRPDDARLWNRLGATLANSVQTTEAISAYRHALSLFPTYVRARYNLGISCMHLKSYNEAIDHFLSALQIQRSPENSPIWSTMRSAVLRVSPPPTPALLDSLDSRDPTQFAETLRQHRSLKF